MPHAQLTLISHPLCPFVQRAAIVLLEKHVPFERINIDLSAKPGWFLALSPSGKVPLLGVALADSTHATLFESTAICEYLNETQGGASLYSDDALSRAQQRAWAEFGVAALSDAWQFLNAKDLEMADSKKTAFRDKLHQLESKLDQGPYFSGSSFSMVDAVFAPIFRYFDVLSPVVSQRERSRHTASFHLIDDTSMPKPIENVTAFFAAYPEDGGRVAIRRWFTPSTVWVNQGVATTRCALKC